MQGPDVGLSDKAKALLELDMKLRIGHYWADACALPPVEGARLLATSKLFGWSDKDIEPKFEMAIRKAQEDCGFAQAGSWQWAVAFQVARIVAGQFGATLYFGP